MRTTFIALLAGVTLVGQVQATTVAPTLADVREAYTRAEALPDSKHIRNMVIVGIACDPAGEKFSCQIGFRIEGETEDRVYLDVATVKRDDEKGLWLLLSGLCRP